MNNQKYNLCCNLKKSDCVELIKNKLSFEDLKEIIKPDYNDLIKILLSKTKKQVQYIVFKHEKIDAENILDVVINNNRKIENDLKNEENDIVVKKINTNENNETENINVENNEVENIDVENIDVENIEVENNKVENIETENKELPINKKLNYVKKLFKNMNEDFILKLYNPFNDNKLSKDDINAISELVESNRLPISDIDNMINAILADKKT